jgi:hypothetical protein
MEETHCTVDRYMHGWMDGWMKTENGSPQSDTRGRNVKKLSFGWRKQTVQWTDTWMDGLM